MDTRVTGAADAPDEVAHVAYVPTRSLFTLLLKNLGLTIVTLGIYRFWAKTALRRFFWSSIRIGDEPLEYTGRGIELFIGFLIVLAIFIGLAAIQGLVQVLALISPFGSGALQAANVIAVFLLVQIAIFRARRYRLSRTLWRGIRCGQDGSTWRYLRIVILYTLLSVVTLGLAVPWARVAIERYVMTNTRVGSQHFSFAATGRGLLPRWLAYYSAVLGVVVLAAVIAFAYFGQLGHFNNPSDAAFAWVIGAVVGFYVLFLLVAALGSIVYRVAEFRYFAGCTELAGLRFRSIAQGWKVVLILIAFGLGSLVAIPIIFVAVSATFGHASIILGHLAGVAVEKGAPVPASYWIADAVISAVIFYSSFFVLTYLWLYVPILKHLCRTMEIRDFAAADAIEQSSETAPRFGEGLADAFDVGVI